MGWNNGRSIKDILPELVLPKSQERPLTNETRKFMRDMVATQPSRANAELADRRDLPYSLSETFLVENGDRFFGSPSLKWQWPRDSYQLVPKIAAIMSQQYHYLLDQQRRK